MHTSICNVPYSELGGFPLQMSSQYLIHVIFYFTLFVCNPLGAGRGTTLRDEDNAVQPHMMHYYYDYYYC